LTKFLPLIAYIATIFVANWAITTFGLVPVGFGLLAPAGVYFAGLAFTFRDLTQEALGRRWTYAAIVIGAALSGLLSGPLAIARSARLTSVTPAGLAGCPSSEARDPSRPRS
jgi:queuosine precursor transporter